MRNILVFLAILVLLLELYRRLHGYWLRYLLVQKKKAIWPRKPAVLRPKSEKDCRFCREEKDKRTVAKRVLPESWQLRKGRGGPKKKIRTEGYFFPNKACEYYVIIIVSDRMRAWKRN